MVKNVIKRSGTVVKYDKNKIKEAIKAATKETDEKISNVDSLVIKVENILNQNFEGSNLPTVEQIQDIVEEILMDSNYHKTAKRYIIYREKRNEERNKWLKGELPISIWERKYRYKGESVEGFLNRVTNGNNKVREHIKEKYFMPAGRILANRGVFKEGKGVTYSNCYVLSEPKDNIESIFEVSKRLARTFSYGG